MLKNGKRIKKEWKKNGKRIKKEWNLLTEKRMKCLMLSIKFDAVN
jgi:hypothetical protein